jgi:hypothetical protein
VHPRQWNAGSLVRTTCVSGRPQWF